MSLKMIAITIVIFQIISFIIWGWGYISYLTITGACFLGLIIGKYYNEKKYIFVIPVICLASLLYSLVSYFYKNPNTLDKNTYASGHYIIVEQKIKNRASGQMNPKNNYFEPPSAMGLYLKNRDDYLLISCSITENGCPFSKESGNEIFIKFKENTLFDRNFAFYINYKGEIYDENYFFDKYDNERKEKLFFIIFYLGLSLVFMVYVWRQKPIQFIQINEGECIGN